MHCCMQHGLGPVRKFISPKQAVYNQLHNNVWPLRSFRQKRWTFRTLSSRIKRERERERQRYARRLFRETWVACSFVFSGQCTRVVAVHCISILNTTTPCIHTAHFWVLCMLETHLQFEEFSFNVIQPLEYDPVVKCSTRSSAAVDFFYIHN
jgi:hypothetical protein